MTEAPRVTLEALPPELLMQMLSYLPPRVSDALPARVPSLARRSG